MYGAQIDINFQFIQSCLHVDDVLPRVTFASYMYHNILAIRVHLPSPV